MKSLVIAAATALPLTLAAGAASAHGTHYVADPIVKPAETHQGHKHHGHKHHMHKHGNKHKHGKRHARKHQAPTYYYGVPAPYQAPVSTYAYSAPITLSDGWSTSWGGGWTSGWPAGWHTGWQGGTPCPVYGW